MTEQWKAVVGAEGRYEVSNLGRVRSLDRTIIRSDGRTRRFKGVLLKPSTDKGAGYQRVVISTWTRRYTARVHDLVARAFIGEPPLGHEARHLDGDPSNNHLSNLLWGTRTQNAADDVRNGVGKQFHTHCSRGHEFIASNLRTSARGWRGCLACKRAHDTSGPGTIQEKADRIYAELTS